MSTTGASRREFAIGLAAAALACRRDPPAPGGVPQRIVSQVVDADEILWELGDRVRPRVAGVSSMADDPRYASAPKRWPPEVPRVPGKSETLLAARPDLVIVAEFSAAEIRALLLSSGIRTLVLAGFDGFDDYRARVRTIGKAVAAPDEAQRLVGQFDDRLSQLRVTRPHSRPRALSWVSGNVAGKHTTFDDIAAAAGLENIAAQNGVQGHQAIPLEQLIVWDPQVVITQCGEDDCDRRRSDLEAAPGWSATVAGRRGGVIPVPSRLLFSAGWGMLETIEWIALRMEKR